jgi:RNase P/RNase MRP subunit p29
VSLVGIVLVETRHTLVLQTEDGAKRRVPKAGSTFLLTLPAVDGDQPRTVHLRGEQLTRHAS